MIKKTSKQTSKEKKIKNDTKTEKKKVLKKNRSNLNSKISNKPKPKKTNKLNSVKNKKEILLQRSSGREEKFNTDRLTKTVSRSGVSFPMARDVAKSITKKIKKSVQNKSIGTTKKKQQQSSSSISTKQKLKTNSKKEPETVIVTASQIKNLIENELKDRNQQDHSPSFSGNTTVSEETSMKITLNDREPVMDKVAANKNKILYDPSKQK